MTWPPRPEDQPAPPGGPTGHPFVDPAGGPVDWDATPPPTYGQQPPPGYWYGQQPPLGGYGVPAAPPARSNTTRVVLLTVGAALALVGVVALLLVVTLRAGDDTPAVAVAPPTVPTTTALAPDELVAALPGDLTGCAATEPAGDGDVAAATCGPAETRPGPVEADFHLYPDATTLTDVLLSDARGLGLEELPVDVDCTTGTGYGEWTYATGATGGLLACGLTDDGQVVLAWTDEEFLVEGAVFGPGTTQDDVAALYRWWTRHSDYTG